MPRPDRRPRPWEDTIVDRIAHALPFIMAGLFLLSLLSVLGGGGQATWLTVACIAVLIALILWRSGRGAGTARHP